MKTKTLLLVALAALALPVSATAHGDACHDRTTLSALASHPLSADAHDYLAYLRAGDVVTATISWAASTPSDVSLHAFRESETCRLSDPACALALALDVGKCRADGEPLNPQRAGTRTVRIEGQQWYHEWIRTAVVADVALATVTHEIDIAAQDGHDLLVEGPYSESYGDFNTDFCRLV